jgi:ubiquinone biosynthesis protein
MILRRYSALIVPGLEQQTPWILHVLAGRHRGPVAQESGSAMRDYGARLKAALTELGPTYVKLGQFIATRPDIAGADLASALAGLQDRMAPGALAVALEDIAAGLGKPVTQLFANIGGAVAAASIAQVHKAEIGDGDQRRYVAVKVLRRGVEDAFAKDLEAFSEAAKWLIWFKPSLARLRPQEAVATLARSVAMELDLRMEAAACDELAEAFAGDAEFRVPKVDWDRTSRTVLTTEWIDGIPLRDRAQLISAGHDPKRLATTVIQTFLRQALAKGFFHADLHQGNLFVDASGRLTAVDFGIMGRLDAAMRRFMAETLHGLLMRDYKRVADIHFAVGFIGAEHTREDFAQAMRAIGEPVFGKSARDVSMARLLAQLLEVTRSFGMQLQPQLLLLQKTMIVVEGVARELDPGHSIWDSARPVVEGWMAENLGAEARIRDAAGGLAAITRTVRNAEAVIAQMSQQGLRLHPETSREIAQAQLQRTRHVRTAVWLGAAALALIALAGLY